MVLGLFWMICWCQNHEQKEKGRFVEMLVLLKEYQCFRRLWISFGVPEREVNKDEFQSRFKLRFIMVLAAFWESFWTPQSLKHRCGCRVLVCRVLGGASGSFGGSDTDLTPKRWRGMAQKACKTRGIRVKENVTQTKRKNAKLQKPCKLHDKRSKRARDYGGGTSRRRENSSKSL